MAAKSRRRNYNSVVVRSFDNGHTWETFKPKNKVDTSATVEIDPTTGQLMVKVSAT